MTRLTANISRSELACKCGCTFDVCDYELLSVAQDAADFFKVRDNADAVILIITSGNRCVSHNREIGGAQNSQHLYGKAMDFKIKTKINNEYRYIGSWELAQYLDGKYPEKYGIGMYPKGRVHLDVRPTKARWNKA